MRNNIKETVLPASFGHKSIHVIQGRCLRIFYRFGVLFFFRQKELVIA